MQSKQYYYSERRGGGGILLLDGRKTPNKHSKKVHTILNLSTVKAVLTRENCPIQKSVNL